MDEVLRSFSSLLNHDSDASATMFPHLEATSSIQQEDGSYDAQGHSTDSLPQTIGDTLFTVSDSTEIQSLFSMTSAERRDHCLPGIRVASFTSLPRAFRDRAIIPEEDEAENDRLYADWRIQTLELPGGSDGSAKQNRGDHIYQVRCISIPR